MYECMRVCMWICVWCIYVTYVCMCVRNVDMKACIDASIYAYTNIYIYICNVYMCDAIYACMHLCMYVLFMHMREKATYCGVM